MTERDRIEKVMQSENLSSGQFAVEIGIQNSTLSHILNNRNNPSLDVLKKILNRFPNVSSDWLILGQGSMFRAEMHSQSLSLFDNFDENTTESDSLAEIIQSKNSSSNTPIQNEILRTETIPEYGTRNLPKNDPDPVQNSPIKEILLEVPATTPKSVKKIILYYSDNTFQEFESK